jgi:glycosyltransferase involved in cell wall biosynthesis
MVPPSMRSRLKFVGFLQFGDTAACYRSCHVLVHTSEYEPWGLVINEAVASGLAVIATGVTGAAVELVRHRENGLIISSGSVDSLIEAMLEITQRDAYKQMQTAAPAALAAWRDAADPVNGFRRAIAHFQIVAARSDRRADSTNSADSIVEDSKRSLQSDVARTELVTR